VSRQRILVCGSRDWTDERAVRLRLSERDVLGSIVIHGAARGVDSFARAACAFNGVHAAAVEPYWEFYGKKAGYLRNLAMLDLEPALIIAFTTGSPGAQLTIDEARKRGIPVEVHGTERPA